MTWYGRAFRSSVLPAVELFLGRRNMVRLGRAISMEARLDVANDMENNGELLVQDRAMKSLPAGRKMVAFDVGAFMGDWTRALLRNAGQREIQVHMFEPASSTYAQLLPNIDTTRAVLINEALSDKKGTANFFVMTAGAGINSLHADPDGAHSVESVSLNTVDDYCQEQGIAHIDLMKIDAEGHDLAVITGARRMLAGKAISILQFEYNHRWVESRHYLKDAFDLLLPLGYALGKVTPRGIEFYPAWHFELESFREGNYLACTEKLAKIFPAIKWWNQGD